MVEKLTDFQALYTILRRILESRGLSRIYKLEF